MLIIRHDIYRRKFSILMTSGFHAQTLMAIVKVKTSKHIFLVVCA